jgi:ribonuclease P protein component
MLSKRFRLQIQNWLKEQQSARRKAQSRKSDFFIVKTSANNLPFSRFGIVVSAKVSKSAVKRNRIKRIIYDFIRLNNLHKSVGKDAVIIVFPPAAKLERKGIERELKLIL